MRQTALWKSHQPKTKVHARHIENSLTHTHYSYPIPKISRPLQVECKLKMQMLFHTRTFMVKGSNSKGSGFCVVHTGGINKCASLLRTNNMWEANYVNQYDQCVDNSRVNMGMAFSERGVDAIISSGCCALTGGLCVAVQVPFKDEQQCVRSKYGKFIFSQRGWCNY